jgi:phage tail sheath protein FI
MAELTYKSAGVGVREIDLSAPTSASPTGTPAGVIGTADRGAAFVPVVVGNYKEFVTKFGSSISERMGPIAMYQWLKNAGSGLYIKVLGVGDAKKRVLSGINSGKVQNAGFVVGAEQVQSNGLFGSNPNAYDSTDIGLGRTHFLGCFMSESAGSTILSEAGLQNSVTAAPILRAVVLTPSGVSLALSSVSTPNDLPSTAAPAQAYGYITGTVDLSSSKQQFVLLLSGHIGSTSYPNIITASFDTAAPNYFGNIFNTDATKIESAGHYMLASWDVHPALAVVTGSGIVPVGSSAEEIAFVCVGAASHNSGSTTVPNFEGFEDRFQTAKSPWIVSQLFGGETMDLFRVHALDDGAWANTKVKISIRNLTPSSDPTSEYGTFDLFVRDFADSDDNQVVLESFVGMSLNPSSQNYFARIIGDTHVYYDFDRESGSQKLTVDGLYPNRSTYIRVEIADSVQSSEVPATALPCGFRGYGHIASYGPGILETDGFSALEDIKQPPVPFRKTLAQGTGAAARVAPYLHWGVQYEKNDSITEPNKNNYADSNAKSNSVYFATYHLDFKNPWMADSIAADSFNKNLFSIENIQVVTGTNGLPDPNKWHLASYSRDGSLGASYSRFLQISDLDDLGSRKYIKFTLGLQGGFDGVNIFDEEKSSLSDLAAHREISDSIGQGGPLGPTVAAYRKAIDVMAEKTDVDAQLITIPGIRSPGVTDYALDAVENRFDALYIMDVQEIAVDGTVITGSDVVPSVSLTASTFKNRQLDSSFGAAYYPDVVIPNPSTGIEVVAPPSVAVLGAFAQNDKIAYPWFAPAGFTRGALGDVIETQTKLNRDNMDALYSSNVNPIATIPGSTSPIINGQKTLLNRTSALDRVNVRRLLIEIRRRVRNAANQILFEPNRETTLARFSALVEPILKQIQAQSGVDRYLVKIDTTTTTQADVENNTIRGKIFVQPTKSIEFVSLDFVVTNAGATI